MLIKNEMRELLGVKGMFLILIVLMIAHICQNVFVFSCTVILVNFIVYKLSLKKTYLQKNVIKNHLKSILKCMFLGPLRRESALEVFKI